MFWSITNLMTISKILERLALSHLKPYITSSEFISELLHAPVILSGCAFNWDSARQSGWWHPSQHRLRISDYDHRTGYIFDTIKHDMLLRWLQSEFGVSRTPLCWINFYLIVHSRPCWNIVIGSRFVAFWYAAELGAWATAIYDYIAPIS